MSNNPNRNNNNNRRRRPRTNDRSERSANETVPRPARRQEPTGMQKFLSVISFGLLGKAEEKKRPQKPTANRQPAASSQPRSGGEGRPPREPKPRREHTPVNPSDITTDRLYVGNLSYDAAESDLFELFNGVGSVQNAEVVVNSRTQRSKGFAFVTMGSVEEARRAVAELANKDFMGRPLQLSGAKPNTRGNGYDSEEQPDESVAA